LTMPQQKGRCRSVLGQKLVEFWMPNKQSEWKMVLPNIWRWIADHIDGQSTPVTKIIPWWGYTYRR
jgi:hypothetical protein